MNSTLEVALSFASLNVKVFPLKYNTKDGQIVHSWLKEASVDENVITNWFKDTNNNLGICTGNGLAVIDIDRKHSDAGMKWMEENIRKFPVTMVVQTPSGGLHIYYWVNKSIHNKVRIIDEVDIRGEHGYVVGAGSVVNGKSYKIVVDHTIADANDFIYDFLDGSKIQEGHRNDTLFKKACSLQAKGIDDTKIRECIQYENEMHCYPPLQKDEVNKIVDSALRYDKGIICNLNRYTTKELLNENCTKSFMIVKDMISVGVTLLGAPQKTGKTFFCLQLTDAISSGIDFLGKETVKGSILYLAFEDHKAMLQQRLKKMKIAEKDNFVIDVLQADSNYDLKSRISKELEYNSDLRLVVIDTFAKIRNSKDRDYESEYREISEYHKLAFEYNLAIVLVTHLRKEINYDHPFDSIYGSRGLTSGADSILVMYKRNHITKNRQLAIQGKDIPDTEITIAQNDNCIFEVVEDEYDEVLDENLSKVMNYVITNKIYEGSHEELCAKLGLNLRGKGLQILLKKNEKLLNDSFINYSKLPRTNRARQIRLTYVGDEKVTV